jgi:hypothetical protein
MDKLLVSLLFLMASCASKATNEKTIDKEFDSITNTNRSVPLDSEQDQLVKIAQEEEAVYNELTVYNGNYLLYTESEGAEGTLALEYLGNKVFKFSLQIVVPGVCEGIIQDTAYVDRTQHAFYSSASCMLHFELLGQQVEVISDGGCDNIKGDCSLSGVYQSIVSQQ